MREVIRREGDAGRRSLPPATMQVLADLRQRIHGGCMACGDPRFRLEFDCDPGGVLVGRFTPTAEDCSYPGVVHGGLGALLADQAMTCCLLGHGVEGVTGELNLRYLKALEISEIELRTRVTKVFAPLYHLECELLQKGALRVVGKGRFLQRTRSNSDK